MHSTMLLRTKEGCYEDTVNGNLASYASKEKVYFVAGPKFGPELMGKILIIVRSIYNLGASAARVHEQLTDIFWVMGYEPSKVDPDFFIRGKGDHYGHVASHVDDVLIWSRNPMEIVSQLEEMYAMKGADIPEYHLGGDVEYLDKH